MTKGLVEAAAEITGRPLDELLNELGEYFTGYAKRSGHGELLDIIGSNLPETLTIRTTCMPASLWPSQICGRPPCYIRREEPGLMYSPGSEQFALLYPFHLVMDEQMGPAIPQLVPGLQIGEPFAGWFQVQRPRIQPTYDAVRVLQRAALLLECLANGVILKGQMLVDEPHGVERLRTTGADLLSTALGRPQPSA